MAYPIIKNRSFLGVPTADGNAMAYFLKKYPLATKGKRTASQRARSRRRK